jgi:hypothetical protein
MKITPEVHDPAFAGECLRDAHWRILNTDSFFAHSKRIAGTGILARLIGPAFLPPFRMHFPQSSSLLPPAKSPEYPVKAQCFLSTFQAGLTIIVNVLRWPLKNCSDWLKSAAVDMTDILMKLV